MRTTMSTGERSIGESILNEAVTEAVDSQNPLSAQKPIGSEKGSLAKAFGRFEKAWPKVVDGMGPESAVVAKEIGSKVADAGKDAMKGLWVPCLRSLKEAKDLELDMLGAKTWSDLKGATPVGILMVDVKGVVIEIAKRLAYEWGKWSVMDNVRETARNLKGRASKNWDVDSFAIDYPWFEDEMFEKDPGTQGKVASEQAKGWDEGVDRMIKHISGKLVVR